ncbi:MAG TPA: Asp-tRNA(Asn)/Glu-tRNA(Gln) amidotransferase subunit GatB, partial [Candidatus Altiarchaeales archaeon]|nr:Asp-tRNA(Asn)/Glu-tRNA(Gln) amidotransferase subunit GatB [Candidatus Altiarchaeales archaeon]
MSELNIRIGLEIHVPLKTEEKLFCDCPTNYYEVDGANINTCPVCTGMPGSKPYPINESALESAIMIARLLNCKIINSQIFVKRKHYNYPDLPSGYQRTSEPIGVDGNLAGVGIWEVHLEEDPGRYDLTTGKVDYNRSGSPLIEIVTAPDMKSAEDVRNFLRELIDLLSYTKRTIDVGGLMRSDVNISIEDGARVEIKNINSVKGAYKAISYEILRQKNLRRRGGTVKQETRGFNEKSMITIPLRIKETAEDYRYIPDPDIPPLQLSHKFITSIKLPETPQNRRIRLVKEYKILERYADIIARKREIADLFEEVAGSINPPLSAVWICREVLKQLNYRGIRLGESKLTPNILIELLKLVEDKKITENTGKKILE